MAEKEEAFLKKEALGKKTEKKEREKSTADLLLDNFIALQKVLADVSAKLVNLTEQISQLLKLFENAAKNFKGKKEAESSEMSRISEKINNLAEQNKVIAKGLSLVEEEAAKEKPKPLPEFRF